MVQAFMKHTCMPDASIKKNPKNKGFEILLKAKIYKTLNYKCLTCNVMER